MHSLQLPVVLALWLEIQGRSLRQMERIRLHRPVVHRRMGKVQASWVRAALNPSDSTHTDTAANPHPRLVLQKSSLFPLGMEVVLSVPRMDVRLLPLSLLLLAYTTLYNHLLPHMANGGYHRTTNRYRQLRNLRHPSSSLPVLQSDQDSLQPMCMLLQMNNKKER